MAEWYYSHLPLRPGRYYFGLNKKRDELVIKSNVSSVHSLIKASNATNFTYKVHGKIDDSQLDAINSLRKFSQKMKCLKHLGCQIAYHDVENSAFLDNLSFVDSCMPQLIADYLLAFWGSSANPSVKDLTERIAFSNPLGFFGDVSMFYPYKIKKLLYYTALGMTAQEEWIDVYDSYSGYLIVQDNNEAECLYFLYKPNETENYLYNNTRFERASCSRYNFGSLYRGEDGEVYVKLNLQIRFKK